MKKFIILLSFLSIIFTGCNLKTPTEKYKLAKFSQTKNHIPVAIMIYEDIYKNNPKSKEAPLALYELAKIYTENSDIPKTIAGLKSIAYCDSIIKKYPNSDLKLKALYYKALTYQYKVKDYKNATIIYQNIISNYPNSKYATLSKEMLETLGEK
jgi:TolA-binding protein